MNISNFSQLFALVRNNNLVTIVNYKKKDGSSRNIQCTLNFESIPKDKLPTPNEELTRKKLSEKGYITIFDIDKNDWRSLIVKKIKVCVVQGKVYNVDING